MAPLEVLYGCRCRTLLNWIKLGEKVIFGPDLVEEVEATIPCIQDNLKATKSCQKTYANKRNRPLEFKVGDHVYLRVSPMKGVKRFGVKGKLAPRYIGPFPILEKCLKAHVDVVLPEVTLLEADLSYPKHPIEVLDQKDRVTRHKTIKFFKIQWSNHSEEKATWESDDFLHSRNLDFILP
jgi:hypothetical protein